MKAQQTINSGNNNINIFNCNEINEPIFINPKPGNFIEENDLNNFLNNSLDLQNKKSHGSSIKTNATMSEIEQKENENFSFFSFNNFQVKENVIEKKELTKDSIDILNNFILKEKIIISNKNINNVQINFPNNMFIKDIKNNLFNLDSKLDNYFKKPFMRKNFKKKDNLFKIKYDIEENVEDEKIKFEKNNFKAADFKIKNYLDEELNDAFDTNDNKI